MTRGTHRLDEPTIRHLVEQIVAARQRGIETILVTSGAIGAGIGQLGLAEKPRHIGDLQAVAAVGQNLLMRAYMTAFGEHDVTVAQLLITADDLSDRQRYVNFGNALHSLFRYGVVPIINENDTVSVDEIRVGDNDTLSAHVANAVGADLLVILTDTDGVFTADPHLHPDAERIPIIEDLTPEVFALALEKPDEKPDKLTRLKLGTGRLATKFKAASIVTSSGMPAALALGSGVNTLTAILDGEDVGTLFLPASTRTNRRKRWIGHAVKPKGSLVTDAGATNAVKRGGKSLLPAGILRVEGEFEFGDSVRCVDENGAEYARGLVNYDSDEVALLCGKRTAAIETTLGYRFADEVIHRDNLVVIENGVSRRET